MNHPTRVKDIQQYWTIAPPETSARCLWWVERIQREGWLPNQRIRSMGYYERAKFFGVYLWEYLNVLVPLIAERS